MVAKVWGIVWTVILGTLFVVEIVDAALPHTKNNPLSNDITGILLFGFLIVLAQWRVIKRHTKLGSLSHNTLKWMGGVFLLLTVLYAIVAQQLQSPSHSASNPTTSSPSVAVMKPKTVHVIASGFTQSAGDVISYGLILRNESTSLTALDISVTSTFLDSRGRSVGIDVQTITGIPSAGLFNVGGSIAPNVSLTVARLDVAVKVGGTTTERLVLPPVTNVTATAGNFSVGSVVGSLRNPYTRLLPSDATIYIVYLNAQGQIVGGDNESTGAAVRPGETVAFHDALPSVTISKTTTAQASVDPDGFPVPGSGTIKWTST